MPQSDSAKVEEKISQEAIESLAACRIVAIHLKNMFCPELSQLLAVQLAQDSTRSNYLQYRGGGCYIPTGTDRVGAPLSDFYSAIEAKVDVGEILPGKSPASYNGQSTPIVKVIDAISNVWPFGVRNARLSGLSPNVGIARIIEPDSLASGVDDDPHIDSLPRLIDSFTYQLSAIAYLQMPTRGGELEIWDVSTTFAESNCRRNGTINRSSLPPPIVVRPTAGDAILINARLPHAVRSFSEGLRVVQTCFLGLRPQSPIELWS